MSGVTMKRQALRPLAPHEQALAEQNHDLVFRFLRANRLPESEYYDVVIFRYLLTVENWFRRPDLYHYRFSTVAWNAMSSALHHELEKKCRQVKTVSLEDVIPGCESLTWGEVVTEECGDIVILADLPALFMKVAVDQVVVFGGELALPFRHGPGRSRPSSWLRGQFAVGVATIMRGAAHARRRSHRRWRSDPHYLEVGGWAFPPPPHRRTWHPPPPHAGQA